MVGGGGKGEEEGGRIDSTEGILVTQRQEFSYMDFVHCICTQYTRDERRKEERSKQTCTGSQSPVVS